MRIVAGTLRGRTLATPSGDTTRPTAERVRQALFDMLRHADWAEGALDGPVLDAFAGSGALGLEALSRGATRAVFIERDRTALDCVRANVAACRVEAQSLVIAGDATRPPALRAEWGGAGLVFLDPPYGQTLIPPALAGLRARGWIRPDALVVAEIGAEEVAPSDAALLAERRHGAARLCIWRVADPGH